MSVIGFLLFFSLPLAAIGLLGAAEWKRRRGQAAAYRALVVATLPLALTYLYVAHAADGWAYLAFDGVALAFTATTVAVALAVAWVVQRRKGGALPSQVASPWLMAVPALLIVGGVVWTIVLLAKNR